MPDPPDSHRRYRPDFTNLRPTTPVWTVLGTLGDGIQSRAEPAVVK